MNKAFIKTFGLKESIVIDILKNIPKDDNVNYVVTSQFLDVKIEIQFDVNSNASIVQSFMSTICEKLNKYIYANDDIEMSDLVLQLLHLSNKTLSVVETITGGMILSNLISCDTPLVEHIKEGVVLNSDISKIELLNYTGQNKLQFTDITVESAYEMTANMLEISKSSIVVTTCGNFDNDICFVAVGDSEGIHVYKNKITGNKKDIMESLTKCALFYLIKKLKQNDLLFNQIIV